MENRSARPSMFLLRRKIWILPTLPARTAARLKMPRRKLANAAIRSALGKDYTIVSYGDADAEDQVKVFLKASLEVASRKPKMAELEQQLTYAFMLRAGNEAEIQPLARMMTTRSLPAEAPVYIVSQLG